MLAQNYHIASDSTQVTLTTFMVLLFRFWSWSPSAFIVWKRAEHSVKFLLLCSTDSEERNSKGFGMTWVWVNELILIQSFSSRTEPVVKMHVTSLRIKVSFRYNQIYCFICCVTALWPFPVTQDSRQGAWLKIKSFFFPLYHFKEFKHKRESIIERLEILFQVLHFGY